MSESTRRAFLAVAGAGTAAGVMTAAVPNAAGATPSAAPATKVLPRHATGSLAAYVKDVRAGEVLLMAGDREVLITDKDLVARLAHALADAVAETR